MHSSSYFFAYLLGASPRASDFVASSRSALCLFPSGDCPRADCHEVARRWASRCIPISNMATAHVEEVRKNFRTLRVTYVFTKALLPKNEKKLILGNVCSIIIL